MEVLEEQSANLHHLSGRLAKFIALYEIAADKIERHEVLTGQRMAEIEARFQGQVDVIHESFTEFKEILSEMGIARWRLAAEETLKSGKEHLDVLQQSSQVLLDNVAGGVKKFEQVRDAAILQLNEATKLIGLKEFRQATQDYCDSLKKQTADILDRLDKSTGWFYWQRIVMIVIVGIVSAMTTTFVLTNQFPWETRNQVSLERTAGQTLLKAWPHLSKEDQHYLKKLANNP